jgi:hypothetical protein
MPTAKTMGERMQPRHKQLPSQPNPVCDNFVYAQSPYAEFAFCAMAE